MGKNTVQTQQRVEKCYSDFAPSKTIICQWYVDFKCSRTYTNDTECSGRPNEAVTPENIKQVFKIMMDDCKLKVSDTAEIVNISTGGESTILHEKWGLKKIFSKTNQRFRELFGTVYSQ